MRLYTIISHTASPNHEDVDNTHGDRWRGPVLTEGQDVVHGAAGQHARDHSARSRTLVFFTREAAATSEPKSQHITRATSLPLIRTDDDDGDDARTRFTADARTYFYYVVCYYTYFNYIFYYTQ